MANVFGDGERFEVTGDWEGDNSNTIWEWLDIPVKSKEREMLEKISTSKSVKVRYEGRQYYKDRNITSKEKDIISKTLKIYDRLQ